MKKHLWTLFFVFSSLSLPALDLRWDLDISFSYQPFSFVKDFGSGIYGKDKTIIYEDVFEEYYYYDEKNNLITIGEFNVPKYNIIHDKFGHYTAYQAELKHRSGFNLGFGFSYDSGYKIDDNFVGHIADILGHLGFQVFSIRVTNFSLPGKVIFYDFETKQSTTRAFTNRRTTVELLYNFYKDYDWYWDWNDDWEGEPTGWSLGIYYQNASLAGEKTESIYHSYGIMFGFDNFSAFLKAYDLLAEKYYYGGFHFGFWTEIWWRLGFGGPILFDYYGDTTFGALFAVGKDENSFLLGGIGYNFEMNLGALRHGLIIRAGIKF